MSRIFNYYIWVMIFFRLYNFILDIIKVFYYQASAVISKAEVLSAFIRVDSLPIDSHNSGNTLGKSWISSI